MVRASPTLVLPLRYGLMDLGANERAAHKGQGHEEHVGMNAVSTGLPTSTSPDIKMHMLRVWLSIFVSP